MDMPTLMYGTAWKEEQTSRLVSEALRAGFRGIDTANQRKHYDEEGVGLGLQEFLSHAPISRDDLFLQTKFTYRPGQDHRLPYDPNAPRSERW
ncbi:MAG: aldo/keto reductase, partial [Myxococcota bacterium]